MSSCAGVLPKYAADAAAIPNAPCPQYTLLTYASSVCSLLRRFSNSSDSRISASLRVTVRSFESTMFFISCCVMVDPPPSLPNETTARPRPLTSTPRCWKNLWSSVATMACHAGAATSLSRTDCDDSVATTRPHTS